jgi:hypothetical protein
VFGGGERDIRPPTSPPERELRRPPIPAHPFPPNKKDDTSGQVGKSQERRKKRTNQINKSIKIANKISQVI